MSIYAAISAYIVVSTSLSKEALVELSIGVKCFFRKTAADCDGSWGRLVIECVMKHPNDALRIAIGIGGMRIVDKELDMMDGYEFMKVINGCSTDNDKISKV